MSSQASAMTTGLLEIHGEKAGAIMASSSSAQTVSAAKRLHMAHASLTNTPPGPQ